MLSNEPYDILQHPWDAIEEAALQADPPVPEKCLDGKDHQFTVDDDTTYLRKCCVCGAFLHTWKTYWEVPC